MPGFPADAGTEGAPATGGTPGGTPDLAPDDAPDGAPCLAVPGLATLFGVAALVLLALQRALRLPSAFGIEDLLGWSSPSVVVAAVRVWCGGDHGGWAAALAYLLIDTGLFVACYAVLLLALIRHARALLATGESPLGRFCRFLLGWPARVALLALVVVDLAENLGGVRRLDASAWYSVFAALAALLMFVCLWLLATPVMRAFQRPAWVGVGIAVLGVAVLVAIGYVARPDCGLAGFAPTTPHAWAHDVKGPVAALAAGLPLLGYVVWWFGAGFDVERQQGERNGQAATRAGIAGVVGRSRYVLLSLAIFAVLLLALDQARDVTLALGDFTGAVTGGGTGGGAGGDGDDAGPGALLRLLWQVIVLAASGVAIVVLSYSCWLWTRLASMVRRPALRMTAGHEGVTAETYAFARVWARLLAIVPLATICILVAFALGDAALAARRAGAGWPWFFNLLVLIGFAGATVLIGIGLITRRRRRRMRDETAYYNAVADVRELIWTGTAPRQRRIDRSSSTGSGDGLAGRTATRLAAVVAASIPARIRPAFPAILRRCTRPVWLPLVALGLMVVLRAAAAVCPEVTATAPAGLAIMTLALAWWLGVLGVLALFEQRHAVPYVLIPIAWVGMLTALGATDNHRLDWAQSPEYTTRIDAVLAGLRHEGLLALVVLAAACALAWAASVIPSSRLQRLRPPRFVRDRPATSRWAVAIGGFVVALLVLGQLDPSAPATGTPAASGYAASGPAASAPLAVAMPEPVYVAAEGGGIRSAYWTAQALVALSEGSSDVGRRLHLLSGVSGGSLGIAVYLACLHQASAQPAGGDRRAALGPCVDRTMQRVDGLSPLLGGLMFEDVLARLLPTGWACDHPSCGHLSRALLFEREWIRALPALATPLSRLSAAAPRLAFNGTWVESGNRTVVATPTGAAEPSPFPSATRLLDCLPGDPGLVAAAHASARFPYINPLASIVPASIDPSRACGTAGHLIDGGYFDNSGTATLLDAIRAPARHPDGGAVRPTAILIRNGQSEPACDAAQGREPGAACFAIDRTPPGVDASAPGRRLEKPVDRRRWNFYAAELGPLTTLLNVSGVGAHGRHAPAQLSRALQPLRPDEASRPGAPLDPSGPLRLIEQIDAGELVPLGWYLSPQARRSLDTQLCQVTGYRCPAGKTTPDPTR